MAAFAALTVQHDGTRVVSRQLFARDKGACQVHAGRRVTLREPPCAIAIANHRLVATEVSDRKPGFRSPRFPIAITPH
jgi:hypothetical protein